MSLESDISALKSQCNALERENSQLRNEINAMASSVDSAVSSVASAKEMTMNMLTNGEKTIVNDDGILHGVDKKQEDIKQMMILYKNMENAYKTIRKLNGDLRHHQDGEKNVRKMLVAIMENEVKTLALESTITKQAEKQYNQTQYFFLSYVMMDLIHTKDGKHEAAERARKKALEMDKRRSTWVYFIIALRRGDEKQLKEWTNELVKTPLLGSEERFLKLLTVIALCDKGVVAEKLRAYIGVDKISDEDKADFISKISSSYSDSMKITPPEFKNMDKHVDEYGQLKTALFGAMNNESIMGYIQKIGGGSSSKARMQFYSDVFDDAMEYCRSPKSDEIRKEISKQEKIIEAKGNETDAMALQVKEDIMLASDLDVEGCLFKWLTGSEDFAGKETITEFSYGKFKSSYKRAYRNYVNLYRNKYIEDLTLNIEEYSAKTSFKDVEEDTKKVENFLVERCNKEKSAIKDTKFYICTVIGAVLIIAGIILNFLTNVIPSPVNTVCLVVGVVGGLALILLGVKIKYSNYQALNLADAKLAADRIKYNEALRCVYSEVESYREMYKQYDAKAIDESQF
ncbi:MAG: hypothetical protein K2L70_02995 [Clostridia bacterium]|nr:hypothetical protein [Clostridia bacterium]